MSDFSHQTLLVTGASGHLGREAVEYLLARGAKKVIAGTRHPDRIADLAARGVEVRRVDFDDAAGMQQAFAGVDRVLFVSSDVLDLDGTRLRQHRNAIAALNQSAVSHVVYTSYIGASPNRGLIQNDHYWTEHALAGSRFTWTSLRNHPYADFLIGSVAAAVASGKRPDATAGQPRGYVMRSDCARAAAGALLQANDSRIYDVTGPHAVTLDEIARTMAEATGKPIVRVDVSPTELRDILASSGMPGFFADAFVSFDVDAAEGYHALATPAVELFTGSKPQSVLDFLRANIGRA